MVRNFPPVYCSVEIGATNQWKNCSKNNTKCSRKQKTTASNAFLGFSLLHFPPQKLILQDYAELCGKNARIPPPLPRPKGGRLGAVLHFKKLHLLRTDLEQCNRTLPPHDSRGFIVLWLTDTGKHTHRQWPAMAGGEQLDGALRDSKITGRECNQMNCSDHRECKCG